MPVTTNFRKSPLLFETMRICSTTRNLPAHTLCRSKRFDVHAHRVDTDFCTCVEPNGSKPVFCEQDCSIIHLLMNGEPLRRWFVDNRATTCHIHGFPIPLGVVDESYEVKLDDPVMQYLWTLGWLGHWNHRTWYEIVATDSGLDRLDAWIEWTDPWYRTYSGKFTVTIDQGEQ